MLKKTLLAIAVLALLAVPAMAPPPPLAQGPPPQSQLIYVNAKLAQWCGIDGLDNMMIDIAWSGTYADGKQTDGFKYAANFDGQLDASLTRSRGAVTDGQYRCCVKAEGSYGPWSTTYPGHGYKYFSATIGFPFDSRNPATWADGELQVGVWHANMLSYASSSGFCDNTVIITVAP